MKRVSAWLLRLFGIRDEWERCEGCGRLKLRGDRLDREAAALSDLLADRITYDEYAERVA